jgi:hypothetical protein
LFRAYKYPAMNAPKKSRRGDRDESTLAFDVTQEIDPALADLLRRSSEPTLTQGDFDDLSVELPQTPKPRT